MLNPAKDNRFRRTCRVAALLCVMLSGCVASFAQQSDTFEHALSLFNRRQFSEAAKAFAVVVANDPARTEAQLYLAKSLINIERYVEAEATLRRYTQAAPASQDGHYLLAYTLFRQGRAAESLKTYEHAASLNALDSDDLKIIGLNYALLGDYERSATYLKQSLAANPANTEALYYFGRARFTQNLFAEAFDAFNEVLRRDPRHVRAQNNLGQVLEARNDVDGAIAAYRRAIELDAASLKPSELPLLNLGTLLLEKNEIEDALSLLTRASMANPSSAKVRFHLGKVYLRLGRLTDAEREFLQATKIDPRDVAAHYQLGRLYHRQGKRELARQVLSVSERLRVKTN